MNSALTRRRFLQQTFLGTAGLALGPSVVAAARREAQGAFSLVLLGDLHLDKLEHHNLPWLRQHLRNPQTLSQIEEYNRLTAEVTPKLFAAVRDAIARLRQSETTSPFLTVQTGDFVEGNCGSAELSQVHYEYAVDFVRRAALGTPFLLTKGNHEVTDKGAVKAFESVVLPFLSEQLRLAGQPGADLQKAYFSVAHGDALFVFFDAYDKAASLGWMESLLAKSSPRHLFVVLHPPVVPYAARADWYLFAKDTEREQRRRLLNLLGKHRAIVLSGHLHRFNATARQTEQGTFCQLAMSSVVPSVEVKAATVLSGIKAYTPAQLDLEPDYSPETRAERRAILEAEAPFIKHFEYADVPGYAVLAVQGGKVEARIYAGATANLWKTVDVSALLAL